MTTPHWKPWTYTLSKKPDDFQEMLHRGTKLSAYLYRLIEWQKKMRDNNDGDGGGDTTEMSASNDKLTTATNTTKNDNSDYEKWLEITEEDVRTAKLPSAYEDVAALQEIAQVTQAEWDSLNEEVTTGLEQLAMRFRCNPNIPIVPTFVFDYAMATSRLASFCSSMNSVKLWSSQYPYMDLATVRALDAKAGSDPDNFPKFLMFAVGGFFYNRYWTDKQLFDLMHDVRNECNISAAAMETHKRRCGSIIPLPRMGRLMNSGVRAEMLADLTYHVILYAQMTINVTVLEHDAKFLKFLPRQELVTALEDLGIVLEGIDGTPVKKSDLIVRLIACIYEDYLEYPDMLDMSWENIDDSKASVPCGAASAEEEISFWDKKAPSTPYHKKSGEHYLELEKARPQLNHFWSTDEKSSDNSSTTKLSPASSSTTNVSV